MCGILLIDTVQTIDPARLHRAHQKLRRRGPNFIRHWQQNHVHIWHSVLHVSGDPSYYHQSQMEDFCAFSGEVYNYREMGYDSDAWCVHDTVRSRPGHLRRLKGPSSWVYSAGDFVCYASDPQGERHLYRYQDRDRIIVASEVAIIAELVDLEPMASRYQNKGWNLLCDTPYRNLTKLEAGRLYINHQPAHVIDSIFDWCQPVTYASLAVATEEFSALWRRVMHDITPEESVTISFSGGIDSSLIAASLPNADLLALDMQDKDPNIACLQQLLSDHQLMRLNRMSVSPEYYAGACLEMTEHTRMPVQSWSHVGKWLVAKHSGNRIVFSGAGADELFGGYQTYRSILYDRAGSSSPYSRYHDENIWSQCMRACNDDPRPATLLLDYIYQVMACDSQGLDRAAGAWSRETRNPFMHPDIMRFALGLPWHMRVSDDTKPVLKKLWRKLYPTQPLWPKQGFAGHANDSAPWLGVTQTGDSGDRIADWQQIATDLFYQTATSLPRSETTAE